MLFEALQINCNRFKQTDLIRKSWFKAKINFIGGLERNEGATMFFIIEKSEETTFEFKQSFATILTMYKNGNTNFF